MAGMTKLTIGILLTPVITLAACTPIRDGGEQATRDTAKAIYETKERIRDLVTYRPKSKALKPVPPSYCYRVMQDILCYRDPQPGAESRLVAYQGTEEVAPEPEPKKLELITKLEEWTEKATSALPPYESRPPALVPAPVPPSSAMYMQDAPAAQPMVTASVEHNHSGQSAAAPPPMPPPVTISAAPEVKGVSE